MYYCTGCIVLSLPGLLQFDILCSTRDRILFDLKYSKLLRDFGLPGLNTKGNYTKSAGILVIGSKLPGKLGNHVIHCSQ